MTLRACIATITLVPVGTDSDGGTDQVSSDVRSEQSVVDVRSSSSDVPVVLPEAAPSAWASVPGAPSADEVAGFMGDLVVVVDSNGDVTACNAAVAAATGRSMADVVGRSVFDMVHPEDQRLAIELYERYTGGSEVFRPAVRLVAPSGSSVTVEFVARRIERDGSRFLVMTGRTDPLLDAEELVEGLRVGVMICDAGGVVTRSNQMAAQLLGTGNVEPRGAVSSLPGTFFRTGPGSLVPVDHPLVTVLSSDRRVDERLVLVGADGARRVVDVEARPVTLRFAGAAAAVMTLTDVTDRAEVEGELERRATVDDLTGVLNRSTFMGLVESSIDALAAGQQLALLFCDLDRFKSINERFGHIEADDLLRAFAENASRAVDGRGLVGRLGGDEFAVAVVVDDDLAADEVADLVRGAIRTAGMATIHVAVTASIGISETGGPRDSDASVVRVGQLIEEADEALRRAKRTGRDRSQHFDDAMRAQRAQQTAMGRLLRDRLDESRVEIAVQPIVDPRTGFVSGGEVLARVRDDEGQLVPAAHWIESAVRNGLVGAVDEAVIVQAAQLLARFTGMERLPIVGVNLSDAMLARPDLEEWLLAVLDDAGADPAGFLIEVPETVFPVIRDRAAEALRSFSARGIWIAVDDFGTGYASLAEVRDLPVDTLKVDRSFVTAEAGSPEEAIFRASLEMARALGCRTVAEGVETEEQLALVMDLGADYVQGFLLGRPMPVDDFVERIRSNPVV